MNKLLAIALIVVSALTMASSAFGAVPSPPAQVSASDGTYTDKIVVTWSEVSSATAYNVYYAPSIESSKLLLGQFTGTFVYVIDAIPGDVWYFWVYSVNSSGESATGTYDTGYVQSTNPEPADLTISILDVMDGAYTPGETLVVDTKIENIGGTASNVSSITYYASTDTDITPSDVNFGHFEIDSLGAGENWHQDVSLLPIPDSMPSGEYYIGAILTIDDANNSNNSRVDATPITIDSSVPSFRMNAGLNDAWYNPATDGQGFFITVFPDLNTVSLAWFTYDTELPSDDAQANLGDAGHRWLTGVGLIDGNQVLMNIVMTSGGLFDTATVIERTDPPGLDGTITLTFDGCNSGTVEYDIPSINQQGIVPIRRVADDNIVLCEALIPNRLR